MSSPSVDGDIDGFIKSLSFTLRLNGITDYRAIRHNPAVQDIAVGQGDNAYGDMVVRLFHETLHTRFLVA